MVDPDPIHYSCILSNGVVIGDYGLSRVILRYNALENRYGVKRNQGSATEIDPVGKSVLGKTSVGSTNIHFDKLVVSPGVDFIRPARNYSAGYTPHAWRAGRQTLNLKGQLRRLKSGGVAVPRIRTCFPFASTISGKVEAKWNFKTVAFTSALPVTMFSR